MPLLPQIAEILDETEKSGDSQTLAVADCLKTIASNGGEQADTGFLVCCAEEIIRAAKNFITRAEETFPLVGFIIVAPANR